MDVVAEVVEGAGVPQMPALARSLAMLARLGPLFTGVEAFWIPALALAADQSEPKASPPEDLDADGLWLAAAELEVVDEKEEVEVNPGLLVAEERGWEVVRVAETEV